MYSLLRRTLVVVAHPDDETGGCGALLQRIAHPVVLFTTNGAPDDHWFWAGYDSAAAYAAQRRREAFAALHTVGVKSLRFLPDENASFVDQRLFRALPFALQGITRAVLDYDPDALLTLAYEGGHPDHDACSFLCSVIGERFALPVWEMPLYHRAASGRLVCQQFLSRHGGEHVLRPTHREAERKRAMLACYQSQSSLPRFVTMATEQFRPQPAYDYSQPPHAGMLNYEAWQWPMSSGEVCEAFVRCLARLGKAPAPLRLAAQADSAGSFSAAADN